MSNFFLIVHNVLIFRYVENASYSSLTSVEGRGRGGNLATPLVSLVSLEGERGEEFYAMFEEGTVQWDTVQVSYRENVKQT